MSPTLEQLPDDVLLEVMQHLSMDDLLTCRLVCKRLGGLALHPYLWRHRQIRIGSVYGRRCQIQKHCLCAVLQLAPCVEKIEYHFDSARCSASTVARCAARCLELKVGSEKVSAAKCTEHVRNQELLGRLRHVELDQFSLTSPGAAVLLRTLAMCSDLEVLEVRWYPPHPLPAGHPEFCQSPTSTLKRFICCLLDASETFVNAVLAGHTATLEEVDLNCYVGFTCYPSRDTAGLLAAMPRLRKVTFGFLPGLKDVARCATLRDVELRLEGSSVNHQQEVVEFLREATQQLRKITLDFEELADQPVFCEELLQALVSSPRPLLEEMNVEELQQLNRLVRVLPRLPGLQRLTVTVHSDASEDLSEVLLLGITPATAPALRLLELDDNTVECAHAWLHSDAMSVVLRANPTLHVRWWDRYACMLDDCQACSRSCHKDLESKGEIGLYSHEPGMCPSPEDHRTEKSIPWLHYPFTTA